MALAGYTLLLQPLGKNGLTPSPAFAAEPALLPGNSIASFNPLANDVTPTAGDDIIPGNICSGSSVLINGAFLLQNDSEPGGGVLSIQEFSQPANGKLVDNYDGTFTYTPKPGFNGKDTFTYTVKLEDSTMAFSGNGHYFQFVEAPGITWTEAKAEAEKRYYRGMQGYLATLMSKEENDFVRVRLRGEGWIGASDAAENGVWRWVTGPEAGTHFSQQVENGTGIPVGGHYTNWHRNEPNDWNNVKEDYGHFFAEGPKGGTWNDYANDVRNIGGYVVEYGGMEERIPDYVATATVTITIDPAPAPVLNTEVVDASCAGKKDGSITLRNSGNVRLEYSLNGGTYSATKLKYEGLEAGIHIIRARGDNGCESEHQVTVGAGADNEKPVVLTKPVTVDLGASCKAVITPEQVDGGSSDNCGIAAMELSRTEFTCADLGANTIALTVTDGNGNVATANATVTVVGDMMAAYPNPFNPYTTIEFFIAEEGAYRLELVDVRGLVIGVIAEGISRGGAFIAHELKSDEYSLAEGLYVARLTTSQRTRNLKIVLKK